MRRPLFWFTVSFLSALSLTLGLGGLSALPVACVGALCCVLLPAAPRVRRGMALCAAASVLLALGAAGLHQRRLAEWQQRKGRTLPFTGWVLEEDLYTWGRGRIWGQVLWEGEPRPVLLDLTTGTKEALLPGQWVAGSILVWEARSDGDAPGGISLYGAAAADPAFIPAPEGFHPLPALAALRRELSDTVYRQAPGDASALVASMLFSRRDLLPQPVLEVLNRAGVRHLTVVSGLHLSILVAWVGAACRRAGLGPRSTGLMAMGAVWITAGLAGFSLSVLRAAVAVSLYLAGRWLGRRSDGLTSLAAAALVLALASPPVVFRAGWQLTFSATLGLLLGAAPLSQWLRDRWQGWFGRVGKGAEALADGLAASIFAQLGTLPVLAVRFGTLPLWGVVTNLFVMPFVGGVLLLGGLGAGCILLGWEAPAGVLLAGARVAGGCILWIAGAVARLPWGIIPIRFWWQLAFCLLLPAGLLGLAGFSARVTPGRLRLMRRGIALAVVVTLLFGWFYGRGEVVVDAGRRTGSAVVVVSGGTVAMVSGEGDYARRVLSEQLLRCGAEGALVLVFPWDGEANEILWWLDTFRPDAAVVPGELIPLLSAQLPGVYLGILPEGREVLPGVWVEHPMPQLVCVTAAGRRVVKSQAGYGMVTEGDLPPGWDLLIDMEGRVYRLNRRVKLTAQLPELY